MKNWQWRKLVSDARTGHGVWGTRFLVTAGIHKNQYCKLIKQDDGGLLEDTIQANIRIKLDLADMAYIHYSDLEFLDQYGMPIVEPVRDMLGREIHLGDHLCFSKNKRGNADTFNSMFIGKVFEMPIRGKLQVFIVNENGNNEKQKYRTTAYIENTSKVIKLPVDDKDLILMLMKDFSAD